MRVGYLIQEIFNRCKDATMGNLNSDYDLWIYSGHDTNVAGVLFALNIFDVIPMFILISFRDSWNKNFKSFFSDCSSNMCHSAEVFILSYINVVAISMYKFSIKSTIPNVSFQSTSLIVAQNVRCPDCLSCIATFYLAKVKPSKLCVRHNYRWTINNSKLFRFISQANENNVLNSILYLSQ